MSLVARVTVMKKPTINDPEGLTVRNSLKDGLKYNEVEEVRMGKIILIKLALDDLEEAKKRVKDMCDKLLANPVIEMYSFEIEPAPDRS